jgi:hypothetical protein
MTGSADRTKVAQLLATRGPLPGDEAAAALGWTLDRWWQTVGNAGEWFEITAKGWVLTPAGRSVAGLEPVGDED